MAKLTLYTNRFCPWAHRAHIALAELGLEFEEVTIELDKPREPWYLEINPRGLVPALKYNDEIIIESGIITQFLADAYPSHLEPTPTSPETALKRARINLFVETFTSKVAGILYGTIILANTAQEKAAKANATIAAIKSDIAPLLQDAAPFFGGSKELTLAEVNAASFVLRIYTLGKEEYGLLPAFLLPELRKIEVWQKWVDAVLAKESVTAIFDEKANAQRWQKKLAQHQAQQKL
ncbi:thioredoxin-like protein [Sphaerosporella brunnea]|uniref:Thioredoxin-like protein n=1 Tax=Sphaerosporella brunnea TaxID=1250544 RepID=A0A5J5FB47_9PEZI|nr:thioredoxin-like protein [Sphaerosporella brunnea]